MHRWAWVVTGAILGVSILTVAATTYLPMNDASSHIATAVIARGLLDGDPFFTEHYRFLPVPLPYWATTLGLVALMPVLGVMKSLHVLFLLYLAALPLAFHVLARREAPENVVALPVVALSGMSWAYWNGESNYVFGQPVVVLAVALFLRTASSRQAAFWGTCGLAVLAYACHIYVLTALVIAVGARAAADLVSRLGRRGSNGVRTRQELLLSPAQWGLVGLTAVLFLVASYFVFIQPGTGANQGSLVFNWSPGKVLEPVAGLFNSPTLTSWAPVLAFLGIVAAAFTVSLILGLRTSSWARVVNARVAIPAGALVVLGCFGPVGIADAQGQMLEGEVSMRFVHAGVVLALAAVRLTSVQSQALILVAATLFGALRLTDAWRLHQRYDRTMLELSREILGRIPERARVLPLLAIPHPNDVEYLGHRLVNYVVIERHGYSPHVFAVSGQQALRHVQLRESREVRNFEITPKEWTFYDYALVQTRLGQAAVPGLGEHARVIAAAQGFQLYEIAHDR